MSINVEYGELYEPSFEKIKSRYIELAKTFHPDSGYTDGGDENFAYITKLKNRAVEELKRGIWKSPGKISIEMLRGGWITFEFTQTDEFELGRTYIGTDKVMFLIEEEFREYYNNAVESIDGIAYADERMEAEFGGHVPTILRQGISKCGYGVLIIRKETEEYPLKDILSRLGNRMDARHVAWIISRLCNICCFLQYNQKVHNAVTVENLFVNPEMHTVSLLGGWWYCVGCGEKMIGTCEQVYEYMTDECKTTGVAQYVTDQEMVHETAKQLLNNKSLVFMKGEHTDIPAAMAAWVRGTSTGCAFEEFENWNRTLDDSWGKREFVKLTVPGIN